MLSVIDGDCYYDRHGMPISVLRWGELFEDMANRLVARDEIGFYVVSTVWLGIDHAFGAGPPLIFESMVFLAGTMEDTHMQRYSTEEQALAGHAALCAEIRAGEAMADAEPQDAEEQR